MPPPAFLSLTTTIALLMASPACLAWQSTHLQLLHGVDYTLGSPERTLLTLEHARGNDAGDVYLFIDAVSRRDIGQDYYGEIYGQLALSPMTGVSWAFGPVREVSLSAGLNAGSEPKGDPFRAWLAGVSLDFSIPGLDLAQLDIHAYRDESVARTGWQVTPVWDSTFALGGQQFRFRGFADWTSGRAGAGRKPQLLTQPQFLWNLGKAMAAGQDVWLGIEYQYWRNKFGIPGARETLPQVTLLWAF